MIMGWYGQSSISEQSYSLLNKEDVIYAVYQTTLSGNAIASFYSNVPSDLNSFEKLEWGKCYLIILKPGSSEINIPYFFSSNSAENGIGTILLNSDNFERERDGYHYYSRNKMFKYAVIEGHETYEINKYMDSIHSAFDTWEKIAKHPNENYVHNVDIFFADLVEEYGQDYVDVLAMASPENFDKPSDQWEFGNTFPTYSQIIINTTNLDYMFSVKDYNGVDLYYSTILHELAHAIGLNYYSMNEFANVPIADYIDSMDGKQKFYYYGDNAFREYRSYFPNSNGLVGVPLADNIPAPRITAHWEEGVGVDSIPRFINGILHPGMTNGMMTPYAGIEETPLTRVTIGFLEDYGYIVDYDLAESYNDLYLSFSRLTCNRSCAINNENKIIKDKSKFKR